MPDPSDEFTREYLGQLTRSKEFQDDMDRPPLFGLCFPPDFVRGYPNEGDPEKIKELEARIEDLERRLTYAEFLAGLSSPADVVVCPENAPVDLIARKLAEGKGSRG